MGMLNEHLFFYVCTEGQSPCAPIIVFCLHTLSEVFHENISLISFCFQIFSRKSCCCTN